MNLFVSDGNPHCVKVLAVLELTGVQCNVQHVSHEGKRIWMQCYLANLLANVPKHFQDLYL